MKVMTIDQKGATVSALDFVETCRTPTKEKLKTYVIAMENGALRDGPLVSKQGPDRFIVRVPDEKNLLHEYILFSENEPNLDFSKVPPRLNFYPIDEHNWKVNCWLGRPGEEFFSEPKEVGAVLTDILEGRKSKFATLRSDGVYEIFIPELNIRGTAAWSK